MYIHPQLQFLLLIFLIESVILLIACSLNQWLFLRIGASKQINDRVIFLIGCICEVIALITFLYSLAELVGFILFK
jgi:hypothetical protein